MFGNISVQAVEMLDWVHVNSPKFLTVSQILTINQTFKRRIKSNMKTLIISSRLSSGMMRLYSPRVYGIGMYHGLGCMVPTV